MVWVHDAVHDLTAACIHAHQQGPSYMHTSWCSCVSTSESNSSLSASQFILGDSQGHDSDMALQTHEKLAYMHQRLLPQACSLCTQDVNLGRGAILPFVLQLRLAGRNIFNRFLRACGPLAVATSMCLLVSRFLSGSYQGPTAQGDISIITT